MNAPLCEAAIVLNLSTRQWAECGKPATQRYRYGCVHEHVSERWTCPDHAPVPDDVGCRRCFEAGHDCPMAFEAVTA